MNLNTKGEIHTLKVVSSNELIRSSFKLSKRALIFIYYLVAKVDSIRHDVFTDFLYSYEEITAILSFDGIRRIGSRKEVFDILDELNQAPIYREDAYDAVKVNRLSSVTYHKEDDTFRLRLDPALRPHLLRLSQYFTEFFYRYIVPMEQTISIRMYALLKSYHSGTGTMEKIFTVKDLKFHL